MDHAKITLSATELELVNNAGWILTKNGIIQKVVELFGQLSESYKTIAASHQLDEEQKAFFRSVKITRGEQYRGLPWVVLDSPRHFTSTDIFAIRTFFWWGNLCSVTLQLNGIYKEKYAGAIEKYFAADNTGGWYIAIATDQWQHHFGEDNYQPLSETGTAIIKTLPFIKLAKKISLQDWEELPLFFQDTYREMVRIISN